MEYLACDVASCSLTLSQPAICCLRGPAKFAMNGEQPEKPPNQISPPLHSDKWRRDPVAFLMNSH